MSKACGATSASSAAPATAWLAVTWCSATLRKTSAPVPASGRLLFPSASASSTSRTGGVPPAWRIRSSACAPIRITSEASRPAMSSKNQAQLAYMSSVAR